MEKEELIQYLKDNIYLEIDKTGYTDGCNVYIALKIAGETISDGSFYIHFNRPQND